MNKKIVTVCFFVTLSVIQAAHGSVRSITAANPIEVSKQISESLPPEDIEPDGLPDRNNPEEVRAFFKKRFEEAARFSTSEPLDISSPSSVDILHSPEYYEHEREKNKTLFQKMYDQAIASLHTDDEQTAQEKAQQEETEETIQSATRFFTLARQYENDVITEPQIPTVSVPLPSGRRILAPAQEHIPYLLSYIDIQANGYIKIEDTIIVVANGEKFARGLSRIFSKYAGSSQKIELILDKVTVNGTEVPYITEEIGRRLIVKPKYNQKLASGVYTYRFSYIVNNQLLRMKDNNLLLNWNLTGIPLNAFITSANAIISVPEGHSFTQLKMFIGEGRHMNDNRTNVYNLAKNVVAFSSNTPILNGERMDVIGVLDKNIFIKDFDKNFSYFLINWGNILYASLGFIMIFISFLLSLFTLKKNSSSNKYSPSYNGSLMRAILIGKYDRVAFVAQLLDFYRKGVINIVEENNRFFIEKENSFGGKLSTKENRAIRALFAKKSTRTEVNNVNNTYFKKAQKILAKVAQNQLGKYRFFHNIGYLIFSVLMLFLTIVFIAMISTNMAQTLIILSATSILYAFYIWILRHKFKHWFTTIPIKVLALLSLGFIWIFSSIYVGGITSIIIALTIFIIFMFLRIFSEQNNFLNEAKDVISRYKEYLLGNAESINLGRDFLNQQSNIFALGISEYFPQNPANKGYYKLDIAEGLRRSLIGILN